MPPPREVRCPGCQKKLCEALGATHIRIRCRCHLLVTVIVTAQRVQVMAAA